MHPTQIPLEDLNKECVIDSLGVKGPLPLWLKGTLIRNGPAKFHFGSQMIHHWFDGMAMLHAFTFEEGKLSYRNRFLRSTAFQDANQGDLKFFGFQQDPCRSIFKRLFSYFLPSLTQTVIQNANVNVMKIAEQYVALTETPLPVCFDPHTLETLGVLDYQDALRKNDCFESAHPHYDCIRKETLNFQIEMGRECTYHLYSVSDRSAKREEIVSMKSDKAAYMHTFALTENYLILVEFPLVLKPIDLLIKSGGFISNFHWEPNRNTRFHLFDRREKKRVRSYETDAFFSFHHVNAYEERDQVVVDLIRYPNPDIVFGSPPKNQRRTLERFRLGEGVISETIAVTSLELPRIDYKRVNTKPYRYVYGVGFDYPERRESEIPLLKVDVNTGEIFEWRERGCLAGEPVFVPHPDQKEDEGALLSVVMDQIHESSFLLILDAKTLTEIARSEGIHRIPYGLHGAYYEGISSSTHPLGTS